jgi:RNA polymerase sigma-70 factor (ECF subfamily)
LNEPYGINKLTDHLFRREAGKMVSVLTKVFGTAYLETAEDVVQQTFIDAINVWKLKGIPDNPSAWLFRVAKNKAIDIIRRNKHTLRFDFTDSEKILLNSGYTFIATMDNLWNEDLVKDDMLRMMFVCCHPGISQENQITLILKTLCGFSTAEIAKTFLTSEDTISKRLYRTKEYFREDNIPFSIPSVNDLKSRTGTVLNAIYLLFNEGYNSTNSEYLIRDDLIEEAIILCKLLTENNNTQLPEAFALMALMCFHAARSECRLTPEGEIVLLQFQDRSKWNAGLISLGNEYMNKAAFGDEISSYHLEAAIAFEHCAAGDFNKTNWVRILELYEWLCKISSSPISELNKTVAVLHVHGAEAALAAIRDITGKQKLESFYLYHSLLGDIYFRLNNSELAKISFETAIKLTHSKTEKKILKDKVACL